MSPQLRAQVQARLAAVAKEREAAEQAELVVSDALRRAATAERVAKHKAKNADAVRTKNAATKRASRAKAKP